MKYTKDESARISGRVRDLARQAAQNEYLTHTGFLSLSEQAIAAAALEEEDSRGFSAGVRKLFFGGMGDADRKILFFLPSWLEKEDLLRQEEAGEGSVACLETRVRGARFTGRIGHRDCLGALMHLGIQREQVGDILLTEEGDRAYVFVLSAMADHICRELDTVGRSHVDVKIVPPSACTVRPVLTPVSGSVASVRIDSLLAMVFRLSRSAAQELVAAEEVFADGRTVRSASWVPPEGSRISARGHGKFIYEGEEKTTKKGRIIVRASIFS